MRRRSLLALAPVLLMLLVLAAACGGGGDGDAEQVDSGLLLDRWLRIGEDVRTIVHVYDGELPPGLVDALNPEATEETADEDLIRLPVHPEGVLRGSFYVEQPDGVGRFWLLFDVMKPDTEVESDLLVQLDQSPWQVTAGQSTESLSLVRFTSTVSGNIDGTAAIRPIETADGPGTSIAYLLEIRPGGLVSPPDFELPGSRVLPESFPAGFLVGSGMTIFDVNWGSAAGVAEFNVTLLSTDSASRVSDELREALASEGWELSRDDAVGFATILEFSDADGVISGVASIDAFAEDDSFTSVLIQIRETR